MKFKFLIPICFSILIGFLFGKVIFSNYDNSNTLKAFNEGEKVYLSPMNLEDIEKYVKWMNDFSTTDGLGSSSKVTTFESERAWLINNMDKKEQQFAIVLKETDKLLNKYIKFRAVSQKKYIHNRTLNQINLRKKYYILH